LAPRDETGGAWLKRQGASLYAGIVSPGQHPRLTPVVSFTDY
jgi:hypothetical protein